MRQVKKSDRTLITLIIMIYADLFLCETLQQNDPTVLFSKSGEYHFHQGFHSFYIIG